MYGANAVQRKADRQSAPLEDERSKQITTDNDRPDHPRYRRQSPSYPSDFGLASEGIFWRCGSIQAPILSPIHWNMT